MLRLEKLKPVRKIWIDNIVRCIKVIDLFSYVRK